MAGLYTMQNLIREIEIDIESMKIIANDINYLLNSVSNIEPNNIHKTALGGLASQFYNGVENILKRFLKFRKQAVPIGNDWHIKLLNMFSKKSESIFVFDEKLIQKLNDYRRFRHYFFHGYSHNLNWEILKDGVIDIQDVLNEFIDEVNINLKILNSKSL